MTFPFLRRWRSLVLGLAVALMLLSWLAVLAVTQRLTCVEYLYPELVIPAYRWDLYDNGDTAIFCVAVVIYRGHRFFVGYDRPH